MNVLYRMILLPFLIFNFSFFIFLRLRLSAQKSRGDAPGCVVKGFQPLIPGVTYHAQPGTLNFEPETRNPKPGTRNPEPGTRNPKLSYICSPKLTSNYLYVE